MKSAAFISDAPHAPEPHTVAFVRADVLHAMGVFVMFGHLDATSLQIVDACEIEPPDDITAAPSDLARDERQRERHVLPSHAALRIALIERFGDSIPLASVG